MHSRHLASAPHKLLDLDDRERAVRLIGERKAMVAEERGLPLIKMEAIRDTHHLARHREKGEEGVRRYTAQCPILCPHPDCGATLWLYGLPLHYRKAHGSSKLPDGYTVAGDDLENAVRVGARVKPVADPGRARGGAGAAADDAVGRAGAAGAGPADMGSGAGEVADPRLGEVRMDWPLPKYVQGTRVTKLAASGKASIAFGPATITEVTEGLSSDGAPTILYRLVYDEYRSRAQARYEKLEEKDIRLLPPEQDPKAAAQATRYKTGAASLRSFVGGGTRYQADPEDGH